MRYLVTSALPYINGIKHLGNLAGSMLPADVHARFRRMQGHEVLFICATDEHGAPAELAAEEAHQPVHIYCDEQHALQKRIYEGFRLSFDWFGRTSSIENHRLTQHFSQKLENHGLIAERKTEQLYSVEDGRFLPDRYVEGTCPHCGYNNARGDQCDSCGNLLDPTELINPRSKISGSTQLELRETVNLFLLQQKMQTRVHDWVERSTGWPVLAKSIAEKWLAEGLKERSITRDLSWGIPVVDKEGNPRPGFENKVYYVWFDAPIGYISATQQWAAITGQSWQVWWLDATDVEYIQFMGKDNVAFHTVSFPITLLGSQEPWKKVDRLKAFNWVNWYGDKFSTSHKRGIFMDQALALLPPDYWRWYLMANAPEGGDFSFTWESFQATCNSDLANNLGNFVNRVTRFADTRFQGRVPQDGVPGEHEGHLFRELEERLSRLRRFHEQIEIKKAASETRAIWNLGNEYLTLAAPWTTIKTDPVKAGVAIRIALNLCVLFAQVARPFIPDTAERISEAFHLSPNQLSWPSASSVETLLDNLNASSSFEPPPVLFHKIEDEWVRAQLERFQGQAVTNSCADSEA